MTPYRSYFSLAEHFGQDFGLDVTLFISNPQLGHLTVNPLRACPVTIHLAVLSFPFLFFVIFHPFYIY